MTEKEVLTVAQVAEYLQISELTLYKLLQERGMPGFKVRGSWRIKREDVEAFIKRQKESG